MRVIKPPETLDIGESFSIFLAGSIEMGRATNWQKEAEKTFVKDNVILLNPRRDEWDSSWEQSIDNPIFKEQVEWELEALERADLILMYFEPNTMSPISLLEFGLFGRPILSEGRRSMHRMVVCCPEGYWRKGNVDIVCDRYGIQRFDNLDEMMKWAKELFVFEFYGCCDKCGSHYFNGDDEMNERKRKV